MKKIAFKNQSSKLCIASTLLLMAPLFASCDLNDKEEPILIIEPPMGGFIIDESGIPRRDDGTTQLSENEQRLIKNEVIGYGIQFSSAKHVCCNKGLITIHPIPLFSRPLCSFHIFYFVF